MLILSLLILIFFNFASHSAVHPLKEVVEISKGQLVNNGSLFLDKIEKNKTEAIDSTKTDPVPSNVGLNVTESIDDSEKVKDSNIEDLVTDSKTEDKIVIVAHGDSNDGLAKHVLTVHHEHIAKLMDRLPEMKPSEEEKKETTAEKSVESENSSLKAVPKVAEKVAENITETVAEKKVAQNIITEIVADKATGKAGQTA